MLFIPIIVLLPGTVLLLIFEFINSSQESTTWRIRLLHILNIFVLVTSIVYSLSTIAFAVTITPGIASYYGHIVLGKKFKVNETEEKEIELSDSKLN